MAIDFKKAPTPSKKISEAISKKLKEKKETKDVDLIGTIKELAKRNVESKNESESEDE